MDVGGHGAQALRLGPDAFGQRRIVVARNQQPGAAKAFHGMEEPAYGAIGNGLRVQHVARDQHGVDLALGSDPGQPLHGRKTRFGQMGGGFGVEAAELAADLPVSRMQEQGHGGV
ncbi:hypothetical protein D3C80_1905630 [compost metagenome]